MTMKLKKWLALKAGLCLVCALLWLRYREIITSNLKTANLRHFTSFSWGKWTEENSPEHILCFVNFDSSQAEMTTTDLRANYTAKNGLPLKAETNASLKHCPIIPSGLQGPIKARLTNVSTIPEMEKAYTFLEDGGRYSPKNCVARDKVAVIIPYRDRPKHLRTFLYNIHPFLVKQQLDYGVYIVQQNDTGLFNRAMLMNIGVTEALKQYDYECFVFHDVDLIPEDDRNIYNCPVQPRHMSVAIDSFMYRLPYDDLFGGVSAMTLEQFRTVNGFSNLFWGWGGEDDDMSNRIRQKKLYISRYPANVARYKMLKHPKSEASPERFKYLFRGVQRMDEDGLNSLKYNKTKITRQKLFTTILVKLHS